MKGIRTESTNGHKPVIQEASDFSKLPTIVLEKPPVEETPIGVDRPVTPDTAPAAPRKKPLKAILAGVGVGGAIVAGGFGYHYWQFASTHQSTDNATVTGNIHSISSRLAGTVDQVLVDDNQTVSAGQPLVKLDPRDYQIKLQQAQTDLEAARRKANTAQVNIDLAAQNAQAANTQAQGGVGSAVAAIASAQAQVAEARSGIPQAQAQVAQVDANLQKAQTDLNRFQALYNSGAVARRDLDTAQQAFAVARAQKAAANQGVAQAQAKLAQAQQGVATAQAGLSSSQGGVQEAQAKNVQTTVSRSDYQTAQAAINQAQVALKNAALQLSYTNVTAPVAGRVGRKTVQVGQSVQPGNLLMAIVDNQYWVTANFKETQLEKMRPGQVAEVKLDAFPSKTFSGHLESLSPASGASFALLPPDNATGNFTKVVQRVPVRVTLDADSIRGYESFITPGMSAEVTVTVQ
ncbi:HlyD family secretion protein [Phormidesmis priestleyi ULC007]|uniref:HlyD family secretion protein n=1 Tax=Phormidesmis priestleyi ULC007 TaxID=1920490 RepID=A0A2T1DKB0_9CYAN|nr:HlyD family secretion protein [Phormidesmis priestleyi]PSB20930.1 HlyD family secretion protein [Phormidesmis priestleyi ULC007]PZO51885.1 MAG: HlyD family secretion protein [Phormidesmis priestleyi]